MALRQMIKLCFLFILFFLPAMVLGEKIACTVTVVDIHADPVSDVEVVAYEKENDGLESEDCVHLLCVPKKTNKNGLVTLQLDYKRANQVKIVARKAGYALAWDVFPYNDIAAPNINIILDKPVKFAGRVIDHKGQPVANASVQAQPKISKMRRLEQTPVIGPAEWMTVQTDADGYFRWDCFGADVRADFSVSVPGTKTTYKFTPYYTSSCGYEAGCEDILLTLPESATVRGQVVDDQGKGIADMVVLIKRDYRNRDNSRNDYVPLMAATDESGRFSFEGVPLYSQFLSVLSTDLSKPWVDKTIILDASGSKAQDNVVIQIESGGVVEVGMLDETTQKPIENLLILFSREPASENEWWFTRNFETDADGKARVMLPVGECNVRFWDQRYKRQELKLPTVENGNSSAVTFKLMPQKSLIGVVNGPDGKPATDITVKMTRAQKVLTDSEGAFECVYDRLSEGMCVFARDVERNLAVLSIIGDVDEPVTLILKQAKILKGTVVDAEGNPLAASRVVLNLRWPGNLGEFSREVLTDKAGRFEFRAIPSDMPEGYSLRTTVMTMNHGALTYERLVIENETKDSIELKPIQMSPADQMINGFVSNEDGSPAAALPIFLKGTCQYNHTTFTDEKGRFEVKRLCEGEVRLQAGFGGNGLEAGFVRADAGDTNVKIIIDQDRVHVPEVSLVGRSLPGFDEVGVGGLADQLNGKVLVVCFWDYKQRPSRHFVSELAAFSERIDDAGVEVVLVNLTIMGEDAKKWAKEKSPKFRLGEISEATDEVCFRWGAKSLPWLILTDGEHKVVAEGFSVKELEGKFESR